MRWWPYLDSLCGSLQGYRRSQIRQLVRQHECLSYEDLTRLSARLFERRFWRAVERFPAYAGKVVQHLGALPDKARVLRSADLPLWTRLDQQKLVMDQSRIKVSGGYEHRTGGSTGVPVRFGVTRESFEWRTAVSDRGYGWAGANIGRKVVFVWGEPPHALPLFKQRARAWLEGRVFINSYDMSAKCMAAWCRKINRYRPDAIVGYTGCLVELAQYVKEHPGCLPWKAPSVVTAAEGLLPGQRQLLEDVLGGRVSSSYGSREVMLIGMECSHQRGYHISADNLMVEIVDEQGCVLPPGETGRIIITDFHNDAAPFVRYAIGDLGALAQAPCACGLPFPLLSTVEGRQQETLRTESGTRISALYVGRVMRDRLAVQGFQVRETDAGIEVCYTASHGLSVGEVEEIRSALKAYLGKSIGIALRRVDQLERGVNGKIKTVVDQQA